MSSKLNTIQEYLKTLPEDRKIVLEKIHEIISKNLPKGFEKTISYGMIGYVVPHSIYPSGYHSDPKQPLPFMALASQKSHIALYHMALYSDKELLSWFEKEWKLVSKKKLDMGKSCIRFKKAEDIPLDLIAKLSKKVTVKEWIQIYESKVKK